MDYNEMKRLDIVNILSPEFNAGTLKIREDGRIQITSTIEANSPWVHAQYLEDAHCSFNWQVCYYKFGFIHSRCQDCYKVVARIETLEQMMEVMELQAEQAIPCKCGIEDRMHVNGNYGAYWYNTGLEDGLDMLDRIREELKPLGIEDIFLKRACTEYEHGKGDSNRWEVTEGQKAFEDKLEEMFILDIPKSVDPEWRKEHTLCNWVEFAHSRGDMSYLKYTNNMPLYPAYRKYEREDAA